MEIAHAMPKEPDAPTREFYLRALEKLEEAKVPYVVGGGYAMAYHTGIVRNTKDLDVFVTRANRNWTLDIMRLAGYRIEMTWPHFLCKAIQGDSFIDFLYDSANGLCPVDDEMIDLAVYGEIMGRTVPLCPPEEMVWSKAFVMDRDRFDGADVSHLILACGESFDWTRLMRRFAGQEHVLLVHLTLFAYNYPAHKCVVPKWVTEQLRARVDSEPVPDEQICRGSFLSKDQYHHDFEKWGFKDARVMSHGGPLTQEELQQFLGT